MLRKMEQQLKRSRRKPAKVWECGLKCWKCGNVAKQSIASASECEQAYMSAEVQKSVNQ